MLKLIKNHSGFLFSKIQSANANKNARQGLTPKVDPNVLQTQKINNYYLEFESLSTDSLESIRTKYIFTKKKMGNRRVYIPNKKQYMKRLDMMMGEIEKHHHEIIQRDDPNLPRTIGDKIKLELQNAKVRFYFNLINDDPKMVVIMGGCILLVSYFEYQACQIPHYV